MANPFEVRVPSALEALLAGDKGYDSGRQFSQDRAMSAAGPDLASGNYQGALQRLMQSGNLQGALAVSRLMENNSDRQFRQQESNRAQGNADRSYRLQERQATEKPQYMQIDDGQGGKTLVKIDPLGGAVTAVNPTGTSGTPNNPYLTGGKMNESQSKDGLYASRMIAAEQLFRDPSVVEAGQSLTEEAKSKIPILGNYAVSDNFQKFDQAKRDFINATLRRESGAVIADSEFANAEKQYFPQPGDSKQVLAQKQKNRAEAIRGIGAGAGQGYKPPKILGADNQIVDNPAMRQPSQQQGMTREQYDALPSGSTYTAPDGSVRTKR